MVDKTLEKAPALAAKRQKVNRSALIRNALHQHLKRLHELELEARDRRGYLAQPQREKRSSASGRMPRRGRNAEQGEVRLCRFAPPDKERPVLVLTRDSAVGHLATVTVAPITSTIRGVPSEVVLDIDDGMKSRCAVNLHNAVTLTQARLGRRVSALSAERMREVCAALRFSLGCD